MALGGVIAHSNPHDGIVVHSSAHEVRSSVAPTLWKSYLKDRRVRLRKQRHRSRGQGMAAETTPPFSDTHPSCGRPADDLPSGTVGQWHPVTGQWWNELQGGDPKTDQVTQTQNSRAGNPMRKRPNCHRKEELSKQCGWHLCKRKGLAPKTPAYEGEGTQEPWRRGATGFCRLSRQLLVPIPQRPQQELEELRLEEGKPPREAAVEPEPERQEELRVDPSAKKGKRLKSENTKSESLDSIPQGGT